MYVGYNPTGPSGNAYVILGRVEAKLKEHHKSRVGEHGISDETIAEYIREATSSDYDHLIHTTQQYVHLIEVAD